MKQPTPLLIALSFGATALIAHAAPASADDRVAAAAAPSAAPIAVTKPAPVERVHSVNGNPMGFLFGSYGLTYEHLSGSNGILVEGGFSHSSSGDTSATAYGGAVGYRWHWRGRQNSGFLGINAGFYAGTAAASSEDGSVMTDMTIRTAQLVMNVGKRWQFDSGLNITARIGGGKAKRWVSTESTDPDAQQAVADVQDMLDFIPIALDGELSLGYSF